MRAFSIASARAVASNPDVFEIENEMPYRFTLFPTELAASSSATPASETLCIVTSRSLSTEKPVTFPSSSVFV